MKKILIITHSRDNDCVDIVQKKLENNGAQVVRFNVDHYPLQTSLTTRFTNGQWSTLLNIGGEFVRIDDITAFWYRRAYNIATGLKEEIDAKYLPSMQGEIRATIFGYLESIQCYSLGKPSIYRRLDSKEEQMKVASSLGFLVPDTCITNDPAEAKDFIARVPGEVIAKMQSSFAIYEDGVESVVFTNRITAEDVDHLDTLKFCPMVFQEMLPKKQELRITVVGRRIFPFAINSQNSDEGKIDWRRDGQKLIDQWIPVDIPQDLSEKINRLMDYYHIDYGAFDIIQTPSDDYYFIEINAAGEFFWLDHLTPNNEISQSIADLLLGEMPRRENGTGTTKLLGESSKQL